MTGILSSISGYFSKSLILGTFLPVVIFIILGRLFLVPLLPSDISFFAPFEGLDKEWKIVAVSFVAIVISGLLYNLNIPILRLYEGYPWRDSWIGSFLTRRHVVRFDTAQYQIEAMRVVLRMMSASADKLPTNESFVKAVIEKRMALGSPLRSSIFSENKWLKIWETWPGRDRLDLTRKQWQAVDADLDATYSAYRREILRNYPGKSGLILPTRLGNVIRSFEYYSDSEYGIDSIAMWPRLVSVIPEDYAVSVDDAKTTFDFMMNCSALSSILAVSILIFGLVFPIPLATGGLLLYWLLKVVAFLLLSYFFYRLSINRAGAWGAMVKGSFDLYRWDLLKKLGYKQVPETRNEERKIWDAISVQMIYGDPFNQEPLAYGKDPATGSAAGSDAPKTAASYPKVSSEPAKAKLEVTRGFKIHATGENLTTYLRVKNTDSSFAEANIRLTEKLSDDYQYEWESARVGSVAVPVTGANPYVFEIGHLLPGKETLLTYTAIPRKKGS